MKWLLLVLGLGCAGVYAANTLYFDQTALSTRPVENAGAEPVGVPSVRRLSSWGPYLPGEVVQRERPRALAASQPTTRPAQKTSSDRLKSIAGASGQNPEAKADPAMAQGNASLAANDGAEQHPNEWAKIILGATVHSEASVSSPTVGYYRVGAELRVVRRQNGWLQLSDPATQKRGWVFEKYLASIDGPSLTQVASEPASENLFAETAPPKPVLPSAKKRTRAAKLPLPVAARPLPLAAKPVVRVAEDVATEAEPPRGRWARRAERRRAFGLFMLGPAGF